MNKTLEYYNNNADAFVTDTANVEFSPLQNEFINLLPKGGRVLDLGCGSGRDSLAYLKAGFDVVSVDGSVEMCKSTEKLTGKKPILSTFAEYAPEGEFDGIWACASLLHLTVDELPGVIKKVSNHLKHGGIMYMSFKYGDFVGNRGERFYTDMTEQSLSEIMSSIPEMHLISTMITSDVRPGRENEKWLNVYYSKLPVLTSLSADNYVRPMQILLTRDRFAELKNRNLRITSKDDYILAITDKDITVYSSDGNCLTRFDYIEIDTGIVVHSATICKDNNPIEAFEVFSNLLLENF